MSSLVRAARILQQPIVAFARSYNATAQKHPAATGLVTTVVKTSGADLFAQMVIEKKRFEDVDWRRHAVFCSFGFFYLGGFQYWLYNHLFVRWSSSITAAVGHWGQAPAKTFIDQAIHHPFFYFPVLYSMKGFVEGRSPQSVYDRYRADLWENCKALWTIWVPAQLVNFSVVPRHLRIPYVAGVSFAWTVVISCMRGKVEVEEEAPALASATAELQHAAAAVASASDAAIGAAAAAAAPSHLLNPSLMAMARAEGVRDAGLKSLVTGASEQRV